MPFRSRVDYWAAYRARVALAALRREESVESVARRFGAEPGEVERWRALLEREAAVAFALAGVEPPGPADRHAQALAEHDRLVAELRRERDEFARQASTQHAASAQREARIAALSAELDATRRHLAAVLASRSWRLTRPLRAGSDSLEALPPSVLDGPALPPLGAAPAPPPAETVPPPEGETERELAQAASLGIAFDPVFYADAYPDVRGFPGGPFRHYLAHGRAEGRMALLPPLELPPRADGDGPRETVLVVSHEASRSGAPVLSLELVARLRARYRVVALLMGPGTIAPDFAREADLVVGPLPRIQSEALVSLVIARLAEAFAFRFAIVNSIGSRLVLPELARRFVPAVTLVHEYASYTRPRSAFAHALLWSGEAVFSAEVVRENALATLAEPWPRAIPVLRQGRCALGHEPVDPATTQAEADRVRRALRPEGLPADAVVVVGVGQVHIRKGVDLFVACAARVLRELGERPCRFVWIGSGFDPEVDVAFSNYLEDQVARSGMGERFALLPETPRIDAAYAAADALLVTSRLDPLPNVGIDAMFAGLPLACFDGTTGLAEVLRDEGLAAECVVPYLDVEALARRVISWIDDPAARRDVGRRLAQAAPRAFDMAAYAGEVERLAIACEAGARAERADYATVVGSERFDAGWVAGRDDVRDLPAVARGYVRAWAAGAFRRKPFPGFHPGVFAQSPAGRAAGGDPFAAWLRAGEPPGPWLAAVIGPDVVADGDSAEALLHVWLAKAASIPALAQACRPPRPGLRIRVSVATGSLAAPLREALGSASPGVEIRVGDPGESAVHGLLKAIAAGEAPGLAGQLSLDAGGDLDSATPSPADEAFVLGHLLGGATEPVRRRFAGDAALGLAWPADPRVLDTVAPCRDVAALAPALGLEAPEGLARDFPGAGAFWMRTLLLAPHATALLESRLGAAAFDRALRRLLPVLAGARDLGTALIHVPGLPR